MKKIICSVYRSPKKEGMYLYVAKSDGLGRVPEALLNQFGKPELAMTMALSADKKLARAEADKVLADIDSQGFYLQMPPSADDEMSAIHAKNSKMGLY
jgi:uncharacterized protein YcgL (UPF0745 family)